MNNQIGCHLKRTLIQVVIRLALSALLVAIVLVNVRTQHLEQYITGHVGWMILAVQPLIVLTAFLVAARMQLLVTPPGVRFWVAFKATLLGVGLNVALPARLSELLKPTYLHEHGSIPFSAGLAAVLVERVTDVITMGLLALLAAGMIWEEGSLVWLFPMVGLLLALPLVSRYEQSFLQMARLMPGKRVRELTTFFLVELAARLRERVLLRALGLGTLAWATTFAALHLVVHMVGSIEISIPQAAFLILAASVGGAAAMLPGGFGSYEAGAILVLQSFGYNFEEALVLAVAMHVTQLAPNVLAAVVILLRERIGLVNLAREAREHLRRSGNHRPVSQQDLV